MKKVILEIDCEIAQLSKITIDGKEVKNVIGLDVHATVSEGKPVVVFQLNGSELATDPLSDVKFFIQPHCLKCGFNGEKYAVGFSETNSDQSPESTRISEGPSLREGTSL